MVLLMNNSIENLEDIIEDNDPIDTFDRVDNININKKILNAKLDTLLSVREKFEKKQEQQITLRKWWGYGLLIIFVIQVLVLLVIVVISIKNGIAVNSSFSIYITGVFIEALILPKQIAEHLFPKEENDKIIELLKELK